MALTQLMNPDSMLDWEKIAQKDIFGLIDVIWLKLWIR